MKFKEFVKIDDAKRIENIQKIVQKRRICVDFDGVIHGYREGWKDGVPYDDPVPGAKETLQELKRRGYEIIIHTARLAPDMTCDYMHVDQEQILLITEYLNKHKIPYDFLAPKIYSDYYLDDRAIRVNPLSEPENSWEAVLKRL